MEKKSLKDRYREETLIFKTTINVVVNMKIFQRFICVWIFTTFFLKKKRNIFSFAIHDVKNVFLGKKANSKWLKQKIYALKWDQTDFYMIFFFTKL